MASSSSLSSKSSCFQCHDSTSNCFKNGWRLRSGERAHLCYRCACVYEEGRFCETFHSTDDGWRDCESCGQLVHCGCVVSFDQYFLLDLGGVICIECSKKNLILARNQRYAREFQTDPIDVPDLAKRVEIEPHYWPDGIDLNLPLNTKTEESVLKPLFEKFLSATDSDVRGGRLVIPKKIAETFFPEISEPKGITMKFLDMENNELEFSFRYWTSFGSRTYFLEGAFRDFLVSRKLQAGDTVSFYQMEPGGKMVIGYRKTSLVKPLYKTST
ncbi:B3 domain-containing transcription factor VAL3-like [Rutidosis leptorrhynchoides]|uniref:B3 domain-containing transcription factor VAL3-like n=1 Tax=Rutidosis leptorrhynchoides TaxID=125765 RepID=UPI003A9989CD